MLYILPCCSGNTSHTLVQWTVSSTVVNLSIVAIYKIEPIETIETKLGVSENKINKHYIETLYFADKYIEKR